MKKERQGKRRVLDILLGLSVLAAYFFPWIETASTKFNTYEYLKRMWESEDIHALYVADFPYIVENFVFGDSEHQFIPILFQIVLILISVCAVLAALGILVSIFTRQPGAFGILGVVISMIAAVGWVSFSLMRDLTKLDACPFIFLGIEFVWFVLARMTDEWGEATRKNKESREARKERKRRLRFPGRYSRLYYHMMWKNLRRQWSDSLILALSCILISAFFFSGIGIWRIFHNSYGKDLSLFGFGLVSIMKEFIIVVIVISIFLLSLSLNFYWKKRMVNYGVLLTLGIRKKSLYSILMTELFGCYILSTAAGMGIGYVIVMTFRRVIGNRFPELGALPVPDKTAYILAVGGLTVFGWIAFHMSRDIYNQNDSMDTRGVAVKKEKMPGKIAFFAFLFGCLLAGGTLYSYTERRTAESVWMLGIFFAGIYFIIANGWGMYLKIKRKIQPVYLRTLMKDHMVSYKFKTSVKYIVLLTIIHISALFFFTVKLVSNQIVEKPEEIFPYDYVCMANKSDEKLFKKLEKSCQAEIISVPMVRATTLDNTEELDKTWPILQGADIGISETTYRQLKELRGEKVKEDLGLDEKGQNIYVVYQQDKGVKSQPLDWWLYLKEPHLRIGHQVQSGEVVFHQTVYTERTIVGEEVGSLVGNFGNGKVENIVVFSDAYFESVKDLWKTVDKYTGLPLAKGLDDKQKEEYLYHGPDRLKLLRIPGEYREAAEEILLKFKENHSYDESFDLRVRSYYSKEETAHQRNLEKLLEQSVDGFIIVMLLVVSVFLILIKVSSEIPEMQRRYRFMQCFGMKKKERKRLERREITRFVYIPILLSACVIPVLTIEVLSLRGFDKADMIVYAGQALHVIIPYLAVWLLGLICLQFYVVRKVEGKLGKIGK